MSNPPFTMSKYMSIKDLLEDKAKYYQEKSEGLEKEVAGLEQDLRDELFAHEETRKQMRLI